MVKPDTIPVTSHDTVIPVDSIDIPDTTKQLPAIEPVLDTTPLSDTLPKVLISGERDTNSIKEGPAALKNEASTVSIPTISYDNETEISGVENEGMPIRYTVTEGMIINRPVFRESVMVNQTQMPQTIYGNAPQRSFINPDWYFFLVMGTLIFIAWVRSLYGGILLKTYQAAVNFSVTLRMFKDNSVLQKQLDNVLIVIYFIGVGLYLHLLESKFERFPFGVHGFPLFLLNTGILMAIYFGRSILIFITGLLFKQQELFEEYRYNISVFNKLLGIIIIPFLLFIIYSNGIFKNTVEWLSISAVGIVILLRIYRGFEFSIKKGVFILYLFLYLCALEMVPIMVLFKWIQSIV